MFHVLKDNSRTQNNLSMQPLICNKNERMKAMELIYAIYNHYCKNIDITTFDNMLSRIDCNNAEDGLKIKPSQQALTALAIDNPLEYTRLMLGNEMQA